MRRSTDDISILFEALRGASKVTLPENPRSTDAKHEDDIKKPKSLSHSRRYNISRLREVGSDSEETPKGASALDERLNAEKDTPNPKAKKSRLTPLKAIKFNCKDCAGGTPKEVSLCPVIDCPLWAYRFGHSIRDARFRQRMLRCRENYPSEYAELREQVAELLRLYDSSSEIALISAFFDDIDQK